MAIGQSDLSLLFKLKAQNDASPAIKATQADIAKLTSSTSAQFGQMQKVTTQSLGAVTQSLTQVGGQLPIVGGAVTSLSSSLGSLTSTAATSAGSVGLIAGAAVLAASALGGTLKAIFDITVAAAEFQGKMLDLSQQTGVAVETLSTLEVIAKTTGGSIDGITASLGIFQKKLEEAQDPTSKEAALLKSLGIEANNTEEAFRQSLAVLAAMPEGFHQTATALELFGRGGKAILAILKEMDGDLDGTTEKFREMGILITTDAAKAADKFNDQLALLGFQFRSLTTIIGSEAMPTILKALEDLSATLSENREAISVWTGALFDAGRGALFLGENVSGIIPLLRELGNIFPSEGSTLARLFAATPLGGGITALAALGQRLEGPFGGLTGAASGLGSGGPGGVRSGVGGKGGDKARADAERRAAKEIALIQRELEESTRVHRLALERERDLDLKSIEDWKEEAIDQAFKLLASQQAIFEQEKANAQKFIKNRQDLTLALREIAQKDTKAQNELLLTVTRVEDEAKKRRDQAALATERQLSQIRVAQREGELERIGILLDRQAILESSAITRVLEIEKEAHAERVLLINTELALLTTSAARAEELTNQKIEVEQRYTDKFKRLTRERIDVLNEEAAASGPGRVGENSSDVIARLAGAAADATAGTPPEQTLNMLIAAAVEARGAFAGLGEAMAGVMGLSREFAGAIESGLTVAFAGLAHAVGRAVHAWVLFGTAGGSFKKFAAEVIASVAQMAVVQAVFELAQGLAMTALAWFTGNPKYAASATAHYLAAAAYGAVGGVAAVIGRGVAGDAFNQPGGGGAGSNSGGGSPQALQTIETDRNRPQRVIMDHRVNVSVNEGRFAEAITATVVSNYNDGGEIREVVGKG